MSGSPFSLSGFSYNGLALEEAIPLIEDIYAAQREELLALLKGLSRRNEPLVVHGKARLTADDLARVLQKLRHGFGFSRTERSALTDAGFDLDELFPQG